MVYYRPSGFANLYDSCHKGQPGPVAQCDSVQNRPTQYLCNMHACISMQHDDDDDEPLKYELRVRVHRVSTKSFCLLLTKLCEISSLLLARLDHYDDDGDDDDNDSDEIDNDDGDGHDDIYRCTHRCTGLS